MNIEFLVDGEEVMVTAHPCDRLSDILHDRLGILSVKTGCQIGRCGSCIVLLDGKAVPSCIVPAFRVRRSEVVTYDGFKSTEGFRDIERGFSEAGVETCGFCLSGKVLLAHHIISESGNPSPKAIEEGLSGISCRCTELSSLVRGIELAMEIRKERRYGPER